MKSQVYLQGDKVEKVIMLLQCGMCLTGWAFQDAMHDTHSRHFVMNVWQNMPN
jgi:hypothetical protein